MYLGGKIQHVIPFKSTCLKKLFQLIRESLLQLKVLSVTFSLAARNPVCNSKHRLCTTLNLHCQRLCDEAASSLCKPSLKDFMYSNETWPLCDRCWRDMHAGRHSCSRWLWLYKYFPLTCAEGEPWIKSFKGDQKFSVGDTPQLVGKQYLSFCPSIIFLKMLMLEQIWQVKFPFAPSSPSESALWQIRHYLAPSPFWLLTGELNHLSSNKGSVCFQGRE